MTADQLRDLVGIIDIDQKLHVGAVLIFGRIDEQEAQAAAADERGDMGDAGLGLDEALDFAGERFRFADMGAGGQEGIHHELRPGRRREEALVHFPEPVDRRHESDDAQEHHGPAEAQREDEKFPVDPERQSPVRIALLGFSAAREGLEKHVAQQRRGGDRRNPAQGQGDEDDPEERVGVFAGGILGEADGREGDDADGGRPEERPLVFRDHFADHFELVPARLDADLDALDDNDGVVREHAERDDERAERDALHQQVALHDT